VGPFDKKIKKFTFLSPPVSTFRYICSNWVKEKFEDTNGVIRKHKSKDRQYNDQKKKDKRTNNDLQNTPSKTKDWATWIPQKVEVDYEKVKQWYIHVSKYM
jgi:hypothetical protein